MTTEAEPMPDLVDDQVDTAGATGDDETGPEISIVLDGRELSDDEITALLQKPPADLTDAEREALQPLFDMVAEQQPQGVDALQVAYGILTDASEALFNKPANGQRLEHKIALGHAMAALVQAQATRQIALLTQQQLQLVHQAQQAAAAKAAGPASILIPR